MKNINGLTQQPILPDGSAFAVGSFPLPQDHWLYAPHEYEPGADEPKELLAPILTHAQRNEVAAAVRYAIRGATMCGKDPAFDPDELVQNAVYALCGPFGRATLAAQAPQQEVLAVDDLAKELDTTRENLQWYMRRYRELQRVQHRMRDPERTMVCDILANGSLLVPEGQRYTAQPTPSGDAEDAAIDAARKEGK